MAVSYELNHERTNRDGIPWFSETGSGARKFHDWATILEDGTTVWGRAVRAVRIGTGATQKQLAKQLGVSERTVRYWERGEMAPLKTNAQIYWKRLLQTTKKGTKA